MFRRLRHARGRVTAFVVFAAVGGLAFAAVEVFANSAGAQQNLLAQTPAATVEHWARVQEDGTLLASSSGGRASLFSDVNPTIYRVKWGATLPSHCVPLVTVEFNPGPGEPSGYGGFASVHVDPSLGRVLVKTFGEDGTNSHQPFYIAVMCP